MSELPEGWATCRLGDYAKLKNGFAFKSTDFVKPSENTVPVIRISDIDGRSASDLEAVHIHSISVVQGFEVKNGDLLIAMSGATTGKVGVYNGKEPAYQNQRVGNIKLLSNDDGCLSFRNHLIKSLSETILKSAYGGAQPNISGKAIEEIIISLPPLAEQKRIADKLDALLARVDRCRTRLDRVPAILKRFRQAVLAAATSGQLTADWREENNRDITEWDDKSLGELIDKIEAGINYQCDERPPLPHERGLVKISAVTWGEYNDEESKTLPNGKDVPESTRVKIDDFLISRANTLELVGACVIVKQVKRPVFLSDKVLRLVMKDNLKKWLLFWLRSESGRQQIESLASGNQLSMRNISQANLRIIRVNLPSLDERDEIVRRVELLFGYADRLALRYAAARAQVDRLTPALLAKAFRGELVAQDPDDEPAGVLLARVRGESRGVAPR